ncbi:MAG: Holliday junction branch migration protein RuvA [Treponemataceae bacterium]|nr:Holliday junction branch migration protein RuvA [Spirochaetales bacterium]MDY6031687.1 Holliday junction branch migration protein RuvA [Treponemataceae bacterium]
MINSIYGTITAKFPQVVYLETSSGIEWELLVSDTTLNSLPNVGSEGRVYAWLLHKEDSMKLFGFSSVEERSVFLDLLKVDGVGPKGALKILSKLSYQALVKILEEEDLSSLEKVPGVGKKTAQKMLLSLKGKLSLDVENSTSFGNSKKSKWEDLVKGLVDMGFDRKNSEEVCEKIAQSLDPNLTQTQKEEQIFRKAILELSV